MTGPKRTKRRAAGDGGISAYQTKVGERYLIKYRVAAVDGIGTRQVLVRGFPTRKAAAATLREKLAEVTRGTHVVPSKLTLGPYLTDTWLPALRLKPSTVASYRKNVRLHVIPYVGALPLASITGQRLTAVYRRLEISGRVDGAGGCQRAPSAMCTRSCTGPCETLWKTGCSQSTLQTGRSRRAPRRRKRRSCTTGRRRN